MLPKIFEYQLADLNYSHNTLIRSLGYSASSVPAKISDQVSELFPQIQNHISIKAGFVINFDYSFSIFNDKFTYNSVEFFVGPILSKQLDDSQSVVIFAATAGQEVTDWYHEVNTRDNLLLAYIIDRIGSDIAEAAAEKLELDLRLELNAQEKSDWELTNRFSPGYCGWDVTEQHKLFAQLPAGFCGIQLSESSVMKPLKSVSGIIGIGSKVKRQPYPCFSCTYEHCYKRYR